MKIINKTIIILIALLVSGLSCLRAQTLPALPKASEVVTGSLPNGMSYYLVTSKEQKGLADFALVQKGPVRRDVARAALTELPHFQSGKPYQYLAKLGVGYQDYGYVRFSPESVVYHFRDVPVDQQAVRDTALLLLFDISETCPYEQAIVVSGDVDKAVVLERMNVFSMMVSRRESAPSSREADWNPSDSLEYSFSETPAGETAEVSVSYSSPRTPREVMNTLQPKVTEMFARELGAIISSRFEQAFREAEIPLAEAGLRYRSSADSPYPEQYTIYVTTAAGYLTRASSLMASVLSGLDSGGALLSEFLMARNGVLGPMAGSSPMTNSDWAEKCVSSFLYGSDLASNKTIIETYAKRDLPAERELELFNSFVSALLDKSVSVSLDFSAPAAADDREGLVAAFSSGWEEKVNPAVVNMSDTLSLSVPKAKAKVLKKIAEPVTGGEMWTFSNGMKVIFKNSKTYPGVFSYGFLINGGYSELPGLVSGEGGFVTDLLLQGDVAGMSGPSFRNLMSANGIVFQPSVSLTDFRITGNAPSDRFLLLLKSLLAVANGRTPRPAAFDYYKQSEKLKFEAFSKRQEGVNAVVDSIMSPGYRLSSYKADAGLGDDLPQRAEQYFEKLFTRCQDGVLVLVGDLDPYMLKKVLPKYLGGFTTAGAISVRPQIDNPLRTGWSTYTVEASGSSVGDGGQSVNVAEAAVAPFTLEKYMAFKVAVMEIRKIVASALAETGMYAEISDDFELFPSEKLVVRISCKPSDKDGLPDGVATEDPFKVLSVLRSALAEFSASGPSAASVKASKASLLAEYSAELSCPEKLIDAALIRYSVGKDFVSGYKDKINAVTPDAVRSILASLDEGAKVEYVFY